MGGLRVAQSGRLRLARSTCLATCLALIACGASLPCMASKDGDDGVACLGGISHTACMRQQLHEAMACCTLAKVSGAMACCWRALLQWVTARWRGRRAS